MNMHKTKKDDSVKTRLSTLVRSLSRVEEMIFVWREEDDVTVKHCIKRSRDIIKCLVTEKEFSWEMIYALGRIKCYTDMAFRSMSAVPYPVSEMHEVHELGDRLTNLEWSAYLLARSIMRHIAEEKASAVTVIDTKQEKK